MRCANVKSESGATINIFLVIGHTTEDGRKHASHVRVLHTSILECEENAHAVGVENTNQKIGKVEKLEKKRLEERKK